jgi:hypothetical protein
MEVDVRRRNKHVMYWGTNTSSCFRKREDFADDIFDPSIRLATTPTPLVIQTLSKPTAHMGAKRLRPDSKKHFHYTMEMLPSRCKYNTQPVSYGFFNDFVRAGIVIHTLPEDTNRKLGVTHVVTHDAD